MRRERMIALMMLAGLPVRDQDVLELARLLRDASFDDAETKVLALTVPDREAILRPLEDCPDGLAELRGVLVGEHEWRKRIGIVQRGTLGSIVPVDDLEFQSLLEQVRELHQLADELAPSKTWIEANVRARLSWDPDPAPLPPEQRELADEVLEVLAQPRLSSWQVRQLQRAFFGKQSISGPPHGVLVREHEWRVRQELVQDGQARSSLSLHWRSAMHAVLVKVSISDVEGSQKELRETVVPRISQLPGFVAGYWTRSDDGSNGRSMLVFESEEAARTAAQRIGPNVPEGVTFESAEVREVVANAQAQGHAAASSGNSNAVEDRGSISPSRSGRRFSPL